MKHTPGPWEAIIDKPRTNPWMAMVSTHEGRRAIDCTESGKDRQEDASNANLIAAAPDMHSALVRARTCIQGLLSRTPVRDADETLAEINSALAKAEGK